MFFTMPGLPNYVEADIRRRVAKAHRLARTGERGASAIEWVIISAVMILIVGVVGGILYNKISAKANNLDLNSPVGP